MSMQTNRFSKQLIKWGKRNSTAAWVDQIAPEWCALACALIIALVFHWGGLFEAQVARADDSLPLCEAGQEYDAGLCYAKCNDGFEGLGPVCWEKCPTGYKDDGAFCRKDTIITAKASYGRGAGTPLTCSNEEEQDGALCYPKCNDGYTGVGPVCWQQCPAGYTDTGAFCRKDGTTIAKDSYPATLSCRAGYTNVAGICWHQCPAGYTDTGAFCEPESFAKHTYTTSGFSCRDGYTWVAFVCWQNCPAGYTDIGVACRRDGSTFAKDSYPATQSCRDGYDNLLGICWQHCPTGYTDTGAFCEPESRAKDSYGRGAGIPLHACGAGLEKDGGLCYPTCKDGYGGAGPVCWQHCPEGFTDDGAFCRKDGIITAKASYGRGVGTIPNCDINNLNCAGNFEVSNNFRPIPSGYKFENWSASSTQYDESTDFDNATLIRMFGASTVCQTGSTAQDCVLKTTAREWREGQLEKWRNGHCYGMATSSQLFFAQLDSPGIYQPGANTTYGLDPITAVRRNITAMASTQDLQAADGSGDGWDGYGVKPSEILNLVRTQLQNKPNDPYVLAIYKTDNAGKRVSGHAVTPFAIENRGDGVYWLHIYDNNKPKDDRYIIFDTNQETWLYGKAATNPADRSGAWQGDTQSDSLRLRPTSAHRLSGWKCPFCPRTTPVAVDGSRVQANDSLEFTLIGTTGLLVVNGQNQATGWDFNAHQYVNAIPGARLIDTMGGADGEENAIVRLPFQDASTLYTVYASSDGLTKTVPIRLFVAGPGYTAAISELTLTPGQTLHMTFRSDGQLVAFSADKAASFRPTISLATDADTSGNGYLFDVAGLELTPGKTITVTLDLSEGALHFQDNDENADTYEMDLLRITPQGQEQRYATDGVTLDTATDGQMNFSTWDGSGAISFVVGGQTQVLENAARQSVFLPLVIK